jgi:fructose-specific phosphotransferase system component IIB
MRYFIVTYYTKANGKVDEATSVANKVKTRDIQTASVILDFKDCSVLKSSMGGVVVPKDFQKIVSFYHQHYPHVIERLFKENGYEIKVEESGSTDPS